MAQLGASEPPREPGDPPSTTELQHQHTHYTVLHDLSRELCFCLQRSFPGQTGLVTFAADVALVPSWSNDPWPSAARRLRKSGLSWIVAPQQANLFRGKVHQKRESCSGCWVGFVFFSLLSCVTCEKTFINELCPPLSFGRGFACRAEPQQNLAGSVDQTDKSSL